ncbi:hypothetical protein NEMBOFW57_000848 [Staphylotrichum longicolle]|uniref:Uncharacterized protein n=1 Tax=Staphylotrichum longicolle TaxID=669026 RepID=A0AAD4F4Y0_9PEZI|nr:hypothetical protein NEMBOFW57_000848 [Staphylotrichum longicolle]
MLSDNPGSSLPSVPARASQPQVPIPDNGYVSPRLQLDRRSPAPGSPFQPSQKQPQHGLNAPRPSLSPLSEYHSGFSDEDLGASSPSPFNLANHRRQHSFPNLLPLAFRSRTPSPTRKTHTRSPSEQMPYTGDGRTNGRTPADSPRGGAGFVNWLSGSAGAANALGLSPHSPNPTSRDGTASPGAEATPTRLRRGTTPDLTTTTPKPTNNTMTTRFMSALSSRFTPTTPTTTRSPSAPSDDPYDELSTLNIEAALFPTSPTASSRTTATPSPPRRRLPRAGRRAARPARRAGAQRDELEEAVTRAAHLKMQLEGMARRVGELEGELAAERRKGASLLEKRGGGLPEEGASMVSEDLGVDEDRRRRRRRRSRGSGGEESDDEDGDTSAESESVFSRCRSPALPVAPTTHAMSSDGAAVMDVAGAPHARSHAGSVNATPKQKGGQQMSAFQKILKGISGEEAGCENCKGQDASVAWDTVGLLRDENRHLKTRVGELEVAVEGALDLVNGIGM